MSGHKRTTISLSNIDIERIQGLEDKLKNVENNYDLIREKVKKSQQFELRNIFEEFQNQEKDFQETFSIALSENIESVDANIQGLKNDFQTALDVQAQTFHENLCNVNNGLHENIFVIIDDFSKQLSQIMDYQFSERDSRFDQLMRDLSTKEIMKNETALKAIQTTNDFFVYLNNNYPVNLYYAKEILELNDEIDQVWKIIEDGLFEAGIVSAQRIYRDLDTIRKNIEEKEIQRKYLLAATRRAFHELFEIIKDRKVINAIGLDQEDLGIEIDVSFWSGDRYRNLLKRISSINDHIESQGAKLSETDLKIFLTQDLPNLKLNLEEAIYWARRNVLASQIRFNIATNVVQALGEQGFILSRGGYAESDQRGLYQVHLIHVDGSEVVIQINAIDGDICSSQLDIENLDASFRSEHELRQRAVEVANSLKHYGLQVGKNQKSRELLLNPTFLVQNDNLQKPESKAIMEQKVEYGRH